MIANFYQFLTWDLLPIILPTLYLDTQRFSEVQRFPEVTDQLGMAILSVIPGNPLLWAFLMENFNLGIAKMFVTSENPLFPNPLPPKTSVLSQLRCRLRLVAHSCVALLHCVASL